jgi:type IV secretion system protein VirD4
MSMFGSRKQQANRRRPNGEQPLFEGFRRGVGGVPTASVRQFPTPEAIASDPNLQFDPANPEGRIFLGLVNAKMKRARLADGREIVAASGGRLVGYGDDRHIVSVAGNRAGKGRALIINNLLTYPGSVIVIDPKGDLADETAAYRDNVLGQRSVLLDPFDAAGAKASAYRSSFNPLQWIDADDPDALIVGASLIADALISMEGEHERHWSEAGKAALEAVILHVCTSPDYEGRRNLATVHRVIMADIDTEACEQAMCDSTAAHGAVALGALCYYTKSERERSSVISTARRHLHFLGYPKMQSVLRDGPLDLAALQREPVTLYLSLPAMMMGSCAGWLRLFVNLALNAFEANQDRRAFQHQQGGHRVLMILDEAAVLGRMERLEKAIGQIAGLGVKLWTIWQDLGQAASIYGKRWESFLGNASVQTFFGNNDQFTLDYIEKRLGQTLVYNPQHRSPTLDAAVNHGELGQSYTLQSHPLLSAHEIAELFDRDDPLLRQLVFLPRIGPVILQRAFYDQHEVFRRLHAKA